ncbi:MAG TPA: hypothetical protein VGK73_15880 [Polyangiaceae bacterium]
MKRALQPVLLVAAALACSSHDDPYYYGDYPYDPYDTDGLPECEPGVEQATIDRGAIRELDAGEGVGATIEYLGEGLWNVAVTCDLVANPSAMGYPCAWEVVVAGLEGGILSFQGERLESEDLIEWYPASPGSPVEDAVKLESLTDVDIDSFSFELPPGEGVWVGARLDGQCGAGLLVWLDGGEDQATDLESVELVPAEP